MGVEISQEDVVITTEVKKKMKVWYEIRGTAEDREMYLNVMNVDGDIVDDGLTLASMSKSDSNPITI